MPIIGQRPTEQAHLPRAWWVPPEQAEVIDRLRLHGISFETIGSPRSLTPDRVTLTEPEHLRPSDGRVPLAARLTHAAARGTMPPGSLRVPADQPRHYGRGLGDRSRLALAMQLAVPALTGDREWQQVKVEGLRIEPIRS